MASKKKKITCDVIKVFNETDTGKVKTRLQIVRWNNRPQVLEKREYYINKDGEETTGKIRGLNSDDMSVIWDNDDAIDDIMSKTFKKKK